MDDLPRGPHPRRPRPTVRHGHRLAQADAECHSCRWAFVQPNGRFDKPVHAVRCPGGRCRRPTRTQQSNTDQQMSFRNLWSSSTSSRIASGSRSRCHWHSSRPAALPLALRATRAAPSRRRPPRARARRRGRRPRPPAAYAACRAAPRSPWPRPSHAPPAARACIIVTSPRTQRGPARSLTRPRVLWLSRLEEVKDVLRARGGPQRGR